MIQAVIACGNSGEIADSEFEQLVKHLQVLLAWAGYDLNCDGQFGPQTKTAIREFQSEIGVKPDGVVDEGVWSALEARSPNRGLPGFWGDLEWVHRREGHAGKVYWPGGESGVTLDPGIDLGYASTSLIASAYKPLLTPEHYAAIEEAIGIRGTEAKRKLDTSPALKEIRVSREQAEKIFPVAAAPYWNAISNRFPVLTEKDTPSSVQTALLSLAYNRGARNRALGVLRAALREKNWDQVAEIIGDMQQDHSLAGIRKRRRQEAELITLDLL